LSDMGLLCAQFDMLSDIVIITSRIDDFEEKISHIQYRKPS